MFCQISNLIDNRLHLSNDKSYCFIIGSNPSNGARSPLLWNHVFQYLKLDIRMVPLDVAEHKLVPLLLALTEDVRFIGGSVAIPYKEKVAQWLGLNCSLETIAIGACNCMLRDRNNKFYGLNTDGQASLSSLISEVDEIKGKNVLVLGGGGAGKAISTYFSKAIGPNAKLYLACRRNFPQEPQLKLMSVYQTLTWPQISDILEHIDIVVNATPLGSGNLIESSPLDIRQISKLKKSCIVFDINYNPPKTLLFDLATSCKLRVFNGLKMNLDQAVLAFYETCKPKLGQLFEADISRIMNNAPSPSN